MNQQDGTPPPEREAHLCELLRQGRMEELDRLAAKPAFICSKCGLKAQQSRYLCQSRPYRR